MSAYRTVVVGTDGSESSLRAVARVVARGGALAGACDARLLGSVPADATGRASVDVLVVHTTG